MIHLSILIMAMYIIAILDSEFIKIHFCDFTQKYKFSALKKMSLIYFFVFKSE